MLTFVSEQREIVQRNGRRRLLLPSLPRRFSDQAWYRFHRERRAIYLAEHCPDGDPTPTQARLISELIEAEWQRQKMQAEADAATGRERHHYLRHVDQAGRRIVLLGRDLMAARTKGKKKPQKEQAKSYRDLVSERGK